MTYTPDRPPLRFVPPPGWPTPTPEWVARNQGWQPPAGWTPPLRRPVYAAPPEWQFWAPEPAHWTPFRATFTSGITSALTWGSIILAIGVLFGVTAIASGDHSFFGMTALFFVFGGIRLATGLSARATVERRVREAIRTAAPVVRYDVDSWAYRAYLDATAGERAQTGRPPMHFDEFGFARDAAGWGAGAESAILAPMRWTAPVVTPKPPMIRKSLRIALLVMIGLILLVALPGLVQSALGG